VKQLLDVADNMGRALEVVPPRQEAEQLDVERAVKLLTGLQEGVQATESILLAVGTVGAPGAGAPGQEGAGNAASSIVPHDQRQWHVPAAT
jgi:hypothetical protein